MAGENLDRDVPEALDGSTAEPPFTWDATAGVRRYGEITLDQVRVLSPSPDLPGIGTTTGVVLTEQESQSFGELDKITL